MDVDVDGRVDGEFQTGQTTVLALVEKARAPVSLVTPTTCIPAIRSLLLPCCDETRAGQEAESPRCHNWVMRRPKSCKIFRPRLSLPCAP